MGALKLTYSENLEVKNCSHLRVAYNFFGSNFSEKEVLSSNPLSFIDPDGGYDGPCNGCDDPDGYAAGQAMDAGTDALWDMCPTCKPSDIMDMYLASRSTAGGLSAAFQNWMEFNPSRLGYEEGLASNYEIVNHVDLKKRNGQYGYWQRVNGGNDNFAFKRGNTSNITLNATSSIGITEQWNVADLGGAFAGMGFAAGSKAFFDGRAGTWMGKDFVLRSTDWGGNGATGGKFKFASKVSTGLKVGGFALGTYNFFQINNQHNAGQISDTRFAIEQSSNFISTVGGILGAAWGIGWETGRAITNIPGYHQNVRLPLQRMLGIIPAAPKPYECVLCPK